MFFQSKIMPPCRFAQIKHVSVLLKGFMIYRQYLGGNFCVNDVTGAILTTRNDSGMSSSSRQSSVSMFASSRAAAVTTSTQPRRTTAKTRGKLWKVCVRTLWYCVHICLKDSLVKLSNCPKAVAKGEGWHQGHVPPPSVENLFSCLFSGKIGLVLTLREGTETAQY